LAAFTDMRPKAGILFKFLVHNVWPKSHVTTTPKKVMPPLIWHICKGRPVDLASIISRELKHVALGGVAGPETRLAFPGFIMGLLKHHEVPVTEPFLEELVSPIDDRYIRGYIKKAATKPLPSSSTVPPLIPPPENDPHQDYPEQDDPHQSMPQQDAPQQFDTFDFTSFQAYMAQYEQRAVERAQAQQQQAFQLAQAQEQRDIHMMSQMAAVFRSNQGIYSHLYDAHQDPRCFAFTPTQFTDSCMWPGDRPIYPGGGTEAGADHGDDDDSERTASFHPSDDMVDDDVAH
jgi:hypothetical protein